MRGEGEATQGARKKKTIFLKLIDYFFPDIYFVLVPFNFGIPTTARTENIYAQRSPERQFYLFCIRNPTTDHSQISNLGNFLCYLLHRKTT